MNAHIGQRLFPVSFNQEINRFRRARGVLLRRQIASLSDHFGRPVRILDVGGRPNYWENVGLANVDKIFLLNTSEMEFDEFQVSEIAGSVFESDIGDARDLSAFASDSIDLVHSNSVIEHVGSWSEMARMAGEVYRVGQAGWIQTPAWEFPVEPHFHVPCMHWLGRPMQAKMLSLSRFEYCRKASRSEKRGLVDSINLLSRREFEVLFPEADIFVERLVFNKSYTARWMPGGSARQV